MHTAALIRKRIQELGANVIFSSAEFLSFGSRNAVDITLCRLCKAGNILRLSLGIFVVHLESEALPNLIEIAHAKAARFKRTITKIIDPTHRKIDNGIFYTNGCKTSFNSIRGRIQFRHISPRKQRETKPTAFATGLKTPSTLSQKEKPEFPGNQKKAKQRNPPRERITRELLLINIQLAKLAINSIEYCLHVTEKKTKFRRRSKRSASTLRAKNQDPMIQTVMLSESTSSFRTPRRY